MQQKEQSLNTDSIEPRFIKGFNTIGLMTLISREVRRFINVYLQTVIAPVVTTLMFYTVFMLAFGGITKQVGNVSFMEFLAPGLIMMTMAQNAFANTSSSLIIAKVQGNIVDLLMPPLSAFELLVGILIGGIARGLVVGLVAIVIVSLFVGMPVHSLPEIIVFAVLGTWMMSALGVMGGIWAEKFDHIAAFTNFVITPFTFLSGTFYSISVLPGIWQKFASLNPFFFMIDGFRAGFITQADSNMWTGILVLLVTNAIISAITYAMIKTGYKTKS